MKKLMTMLAAAAMAFGLYADAITPIDSFDASAGDTTLTDGRWSLAGTEITAPIDEAKIEDSLLKIQTGSKKLTREFLAESASTNIPADGLYFDINLSFLDPVDGSDALADLAGAKIAAAVIDNSDALKEIPGTQLTPSTNLYVIGAYKTADGWTKRAYMLDAEGLSGTAEKRLTIKMYDSVITGTGVTRPGFRFFKEGVDQALPVLLSFPVLDDGTIDFANPEEVTKYLGVEPSDVVSAVRSRYSDKTLLVSLVNGSSAVSAVDFVGKANIADFKLTEDPMFIGPDAFTMSVAYDSEAVVITSVTGKDGLASFDDVNKVITYDAAETELTVTATYGEGLTIVKWTINGTPTTADAPFAPVRNGTLAITAVAPAAYVDGVPFESFFGDDGALAYVNENGGTLKLGADVAVDPKTGEAITISGTGVVLDLAGKTIKSSDDYSASIIVDVDAELTITNSVGTGHVAVPYYNDGSTVSYGNTSVINKGKLVIADGVMDGEVATGDGAAATQIVGGTFDDEIADANEPTVLVTTGGLFNNEKFAQNAIPGVDYETYEAVEAGDYWRVQLAPPKDYVAQVVSADGQTTTPYESLKEAAEAAQAGDTVKVLKAHTFTESFTFFNKGTNDADTINFVNDFEIKSSLAADNYAMFIVGSKVNWSGTGTLIKEYGTASAILVGSGEKAGQSGRPAELGNGYLTFSGKLKGGTNDTYIAGYGAAQKPGDGGAPSNLIKCEAGFCRFNGGTLVNTRTDSNSTKRNGRCVCASAAGGYTGVVEVATCDFIANEPLYQENGGIMKFVGGSSSNARVKQNQGLELDYGKYCDPGQTFVYNEDGKDAGWWTVGLYTFNIVVTDNAGAQGTAQPASFTTEDFTSPFEVTLTKPTAPAGKEFDSWSANYGEITDEKLTLTALPTANESVVVTVVWKDILVTSVTLNKDKLELDIGAEETLVATVLPVGAADKSIAWTTSDAAIATVADGVVTAVADGTATITATNAASGLFATCAVTVKSAIPEVEPIGGKPVVVTADSPEKAIEQVKMKEIEPPADADVLKADYNAYFELKAADLGGGKYNVYAALKDDIVKATEETKALAGKLTEISAAEEGTVSVEVTDAKPGLYYSVIEGQQLTGREEGERTLAEGATVTIKTTKFPGSGFYQIQVSTTPEDVVGGQD